MAKYLALEWDAREARAVVGRARGSDIVLEDAFAVDLSPRAEQEGTTDVGARIAAALAARNVGRTETMVAVGRASIELQQMALPPAPAEDLPDMVRFQAMRQFTTISDDWPLDFVSMEPPEDGAGENVLAAAISPGLVKQIQDTCAAAELTPKRLVLRPFAAASLLCRHERGKQPPPRLMVDLLTDEADLTILVDQQVILMRTVKLPAAEESTVQTRALVSQMLRTIAAAQNQLRARRVEQIIICGDGTDQNSLKELLEQQLSQEVLLIDPLDELTLSRSLQQNRPEHAGRFAPLIGMLLDEATSTRHAMDFLDPRKRPQAPSQARRNVVIGAAVGVLALVATVLIWLSLTELDEDLADLRLEVNSQKKRVEQAEAVRRDVEQVKQFLKSDINWLDEMHQLAQSIPPSEDVVLSQLTMTTRNPEGGQLVLDGFVRAPEQLADVQAALRGDGERQVISTGGQEDQRQELYRWRFKETLLLDPIEPDLKRDAETAVPQMKTADTTRPAEGADVR